MDNHLPEKEERKEDLMEETETIPQRHQGSFTTGFLAGVLTALFCVFVFLTGWGIGERRFAKKDAQSAEEETESGAEILTDPSTLSMLEEVKNLIENNYLNEVDSELLSAYLFKGIAVGLDDPYANYYTAEELNDVMDASRGEYTGIGAVIEQDIKNGELSVNEVYAGRPAELAGLQAGDILEEIDDTDLTDMSLNEVVALIKGADGTFTMKVYRPATDEELTLELTCDDVEVQAVTYKMLEDGIGYIRLSEFTEAAVGQFVDAAEVLEDQGMQKLIVDLRDNPGGLLTSVCDILDEVLPEGLLVYTEDKDGDREEYNSDRLRTVYCELAVLVNENSASASEIFAGAIQDHEAGTIIGTKTYGKGIVQKTFPLSDGSAFKMTVEKYYTPLGQDINGNGITPDIIVDNTAENAADGGENGVSSSKDGETIDEASDPILDKAVEVLREKIAEEAAQSEAG